MDGWVGGRESRVKDCLQQSKNCFLLKMTAVFTFYSRIKDEVKQSGNT
jgi:hypothetical protein